LIRVRVRVRVKIRVRVNDWHFIFHKNASKDFKNEITITFWFHIGFGLEFGLG
jgi:hypothetical protein